MKTEKADNGMMKVYPETQLEKLALEDIKQHLPLFAGTEMNVIHAFIRGYKAAKADKENADNIRLE